MPTRLLAVLLGGVITALTLLLIAGHGPWAGEVLVTVSGSHGLNNGDLPVLGLWLAGIAGCAALVRR